MPEYTCRTCGETKPEYQYYARNRSCCMVCSRTKAMAKYYADPGLAKRMRATSLTWNANNKEWRKFRHLLNSYGLTLDSYYAMEEAQDFVCLICKSDGPLHVDHNHATGKVRGLLCMSCNMGIGNLMDNVGYLTEAICYLAKRGSYAA